MKKTQKFSSLKAGVAPVVLGLALISAPAFAQEAPQAADEESTEGQEIVVTGSLLRNPNLEQASPVNVTTAETISLRQNNVAEEVLRDIPGIVPNIGSAVNNGNGGASFVDLRGLGASRNIVLLDGNRIAPSGLLGRVDLNNIPVALVERVDALTGGAATTYGADAVSGVVNFITRKDFAGMELSVGNKITEKGDGHYFRADLTLGANFDDGRGNATLSIGYQESDPVYQGARSFSIDNIDSFSGFVGGGSGTSVPSRFSGTRPLDPATGLPSTNPAVANGGVRQVNAAGQAVGTFQFFNFNPFNIFQTPFERFNVFGTARYEVADGIEVYSRALFSKNTVNTIIAPSGSFGGTVTIPLSNPYLPTALRNQFCAFNVGAAGTYTPRFDAATCAAAALATSPTDPNFRSVTVTLNRRAVEVGPRISNFQTTIFDFRTGVRGDITDHLGFDVSGSYGESENIQTLQNYTLQSRLRAAVYATNTTSCLASGADRPATAAAVSAGTGCVPINIFGAANSITPNQVPYITAGATTTVRTSLAQARAIINGDFGFTIPSAAEPVNFAIGGEYRQYKADQLADTLSQTAGELGGAGGANPEIHGGYDVYEAYGELNVPIVSDKPFFHSLSAEAGVRYSSYSVDAPNSPSYKTTTYKGALTWAPSEDIKFRGGYAHAVRAPNINELFAPPVTGLTSLVTDPCAGAAPVANANLRSVCIAQGAPAGTIGSITNPTASQANLTSGGNLNLSPETSNSYNFGAVLTPGFAPGLSLTVDYYNIKLKKAITTPTPGDLISACFTGLSAASAASASCLAIQRNPLTGGLDGDPSITRGLLAVLSNLGSLETDGIDVALNYKRDIGFADLTFSTVGNYTMNSKFRANVNIPVSDDAPNRECTGFYSVNCGSLQPKFQWTTRATLGFENIDVSLQWRHIDGFKEEPLSAGPAFSGTLSGGTTGALNGKAVDFTRIPSFDYFDLSTRFAVGDHLELVATVNNLLNKKPPLVGAGIGPTAFNSGNTYPSTYDALGRSYAVTAKLKF